MNSQWEILYQGHASVRVRTRSGTTVYVDPYAGAGYDMPADVVLMSHDHGDHSAIDRVARAGGCLVVSHREACVGGECLRFEKSGVVVQSVPAYNEKHPRENGFVGFLLFFDGITVYIAGDTSMIPEMRELPAKEIDYAFLPCDGVFNMNVSEAGECAEAINAKHSIPYHTCRNTDGDFSMAVAQMFTAKGRIILRPMSAITGEAPGCA